MVFFGGFYKYKTRGEFQKNLGAYNAARNFDIINYLFKNHHNQGFTEKQKISGYWTKEKVQEESIKYKNRSEFKKKLGSAYNAAKKFKIINDLFK